MFSQIFGRTPPAATMRKNVEDFRAIVNANQEKNNDPMWPVQQHVTELLDQTYLMTAYSQAGTTGVTREINTLDCQKLEQYLSYSFTATSVKGRYMDPDTKLFLSARKHPDNTKHCAVQIEWLIDDSPKIEQIPDHKFYADDLYSM